MLRVGLTGGLGGGKSTVGRIFAELGASVIDADEVGRKLMQVGEAVYDRIVEAFGRQVVQQDGTLDRRLLAELAFGGGRIAELNHIVHPVVIAAQGEWMCAVFAADPNAVAIVESALIFEASGGDSGQAPGKAPRDSGQASGDLSVGRGSRHSVTEPTVPGWKDRFDRIILVTAPDDLKVRRFVERSLAHGAGDAEALAADARKRLAAQIPDEHKRPLCDWVIDNSGEVDVLRATVGEIYKSLQAAGVHPSSH